MKIAVLTDTHFGARNNQAAEAIAANQKRFLSETFFPEIDRRGIKTVIHMGDLTDNRQQMPYVQALNMKYDFLEPMAARGIDFHILVGNHDTQYRHTNDFNSIEYHLGPFPQFKIYRETTEVTFDGLPILFVPWICEENREQSYARIEASKAPVMMGHIGVAGFLTNDERSDDKEAHERGRFAKFKAAFFGHYHKRISDGNIYFIGSTQQLTWGEPGEKGFQIFDTNKQKTCDPSYETGMCEFIRNPHQIFHEIHYNDELYTWTHYKKVIENLGLDNAFVRLRVETKNKPFDFERVCALIEEQKPANLTIIDLPLMMESHDNPVEVMEEENLLDIIENVVKSRTYVSTTPESVMSVIKRGYTQAMRKA